MRTICDDFHLEIRVDHDLNVAEVILKMVQEIYFFSAQELQSV